MKSEWHEYGHEDELLRRCTGEELHYLEHFDENEMRYLAWCHDNLRDPESVTSAVDYERDFMERLEAQHYSSLGHHPNN